MEQTEKPEPAQRDYALDVLRAVAAIYIIGFWHHVSYIHLDVLKTPVTKSWAIIALGIFFIVSAYLLTLQQIKNIEKSPIGKRRLDMIREFYAKRVLRIYPLYVIAVLLFYFADIGTWSIPHLITSLTLTAALIDKSPLTLWFVNVIFLYYLALPFLWFYVRTNSRIIFTGLLVFAALFVLHRMTPLIDERIYVYLPSMIFGVLLGKNRNIEVLIKSPFLTLISGVMLLAVLLLAYYNFVSVENISLLLPLLAFPFLLFLSGKIATLQKLPLFWEKLAYASFSAYLFHRVVYELIYRNWIITDQVNAFQLTTISIVVISITFFISYICQYLYDIYFASIVKKQSAELKSST